jgi:hypothetical protein
MADKRRRHLGAARGAPSRSNDLRVAVWLQPAFTLRSQIRGRRSGWKSVFRVFRVFRGQSFLPLVAALLRCLHLRPSLVVVEWLRP